jgi:hypothetical protein
MSHPVNLYCTLWELPELDFPHTLLSRRDSQDPDLNEHLQGFVGFVTHGGSRPMSATLYHVIQHIQRVQNHLTLQVEEANLDALSDWARRANALIVLPDASVRDPAGLVLVSGQDGASHPEAQMPYPADAQQRKECTMALLAEKGISVPAGLPPVLGAGELALRDPEELVGRALALLSVAVYAEGLHSGRPVPSAEIRARLPSAHLSPHEASFLAAQEPTAQQIVNHAWRYEALAVVLWALGHLPALSWPSQVADVPTLAKTVFDLGEQGLLARAAVRSETELLDALDLHVRLHWATRQATREGNTPPADLHTSVLMERHGALNWIACRDDADWDQVDTQT